MNLDPVIHQPSQPRVSPGSYHVEPGTLPLKMAHSHETRVFVHVTIVSKQEKLPPMCTQKNAAGNSHVKLYSHAAPDELKQPGMSIFRMEQDGSGSHQAVI